EHRILLRQDNADLRLTEKGEEIGLVTTERIERFHKKRDEIDRLSSLLESYTVRPEQMDPMLEQLKTSTLSQPVKAKSLIPRPEVHLHHLLEADQELRDKVNGITSDRKVKEQVEIQIKYAGYIEKEFEMVKEISRQENSAIPDSVQYENIQSLSTEGAQKLMKIQPETIGQASRISGVSASDIAVLTIYLKN
ncbi:MAG: tRNA uridine-5-carboxymethylaminomethyl(34) synthesis enzyme MnmG, partial [Balneolaceae bacterium]